MAVSLIVTEQNSPNKDYESIFYENRYNERMKLPLFQKLQVLFYAPFHVRNAAPLAVIPGPCVEAHEEGRSLFHVRLEEKGRLVGPVG